jgi:hypothetical protein
MTVPEFSCWASHDLIVRQLIEIIGKANANSEMRSQVPEAGLGAP